MLKRIQKIKNIGRFVDCNAAGCEFGNETIIFGLNTQGKSTLTAIIRSIQNGNNDILIGRKTFGATSGKYIEFDFDINGTIDKYIFNNRSWNKTNPNILIFDSKFITENVYNGEDITFDQQKKLNTIIIGDKGQMLNNEIISLQKQSDDFANQKTEKTREYNRHFPGIDFKNFKNIPIDPSIDEKIKEKDKEKRFELEKEDIKKSVRSHIQILSDFNFTLQNSLKKTLNIKQDEILTHIKDHFKTVTNAEIFLRDGLNYMKEKSNDGLFRKCVFCGQALNEKAESLLSYYHNYFKGGYEELQKEVSNAIDYFKGINFEAILEKISADLKLRDLDVSLDETMIAMIVDLKKNFDKELEKKRDLNYLINFETFDKIKTLIDQIKDELKDLLTNKLTIHSSRTVSEIEKEKQNLEIIKKRYETAWIEYCSEIENIENEAEKIRINRDHKRKELEDYSSEIFDKHKQNINRFCKIMCADFEIEDFKPLKKIIGKDERIFNIKFFNNHNVDISTQDDKTPNFKNTLSESDKRLLAFSFFLSILSNDEELDKKIIIFDDPISSFDYERRRKTVHLIADITSKRNDSNKPEEILHPMQKIILTHDEHFAKEMFRLMKDSRTLKIKENINDGQKRSTLVHSDFAHDFPDDKISQYLDKLKDMLDNRSFTSNFEVECRAVLEHIFKRKYYIQLKTQISEKKSVRTFTEVLSKEKINGFDNETKLLKFSRLCNDLNIELHDNATTNSQGDKASILNDFFECLKIM